MSWSYHFHREFYDLHHHLVNHYGISVSPIFSRIPVSQFLSILCRVLSTIVCLSSFSYAFFCLLHCLSLFHRDLLPVNKKIEYPHILVYTIYVDSRSFYWPGASPCALRIMASDYPFDIIKLFFNSSPGYFPKRSLLYRYMYMTVK